MTKALLEITPTQAHLAELDEAVAAVLRRGTPLIAVTARQAHLPTFAAVLRECAAAVGDGAGVAVVRGVAPEQGGRYERRLRLWMVGRHLGVAACQTEAGHMVRDEDDCGAYDRFHADAADLTAFLAATASVLDVAAVDAGRRSVRIAAGDLALVDNREALHTAPSGHVHRLWLERQEDRDLPTEFTWTSAAHHAPVARRAVRRQLVAV